jgi:hypothetical protein
MVYVYDEFALQGRRFMANGVLGLGLIMVHLCNEFALQGRFRVIKREY